MTRLGVKGRATRTHTRGKGQLGDGEAARRRPLNPLCSPVLRSLHWEMGPRVTPELGAPLAAGAGPGVGLDLPVSPSHTGGQLLSSKSSNPVLGSISRCFWHQKVPSVNLGTAEGGRGPAYPVGTLSSVSAAQRQECLLPSKENRPPAPSRETQGPALQTSAPRPLPRDSRACWTLPTGPSMPSCPTPGPGQGSPGPRTLPKDLTLHAGRGGTCSNSRVYTHARTRVHSAGRHTAHTRVHAHPLHTPPQHQRTASRSHATLPPETRQPGCAPGSPPAGEASSKQGHRAVMNVVCTQAWSSSWRPGSDGRDSQAWGSGCSCRGLWEMWGSGKPAHDWRVDDHQDTGPSVTASSGPRPRQPWSPAPSHLAAPAGQVPVLGRTDHFS